MGVDWESDPQEALARAGPGGNYFKVDLPDGTQMVHLLKGRFDLQFGRWVVLSLTVNADYIRIVLANLLGLSKRIDWKACSQTESEEKADAQAFKKAFKAFDPAQA